MRRPGTFSAVRVAALAVGMLISPLGVGASTAQEHRDDAPVATDDAMGIVAGDVGQPGGFPETGCPTDYITATNSAHVAAGRATAWLIFAWAKGSNQYVGLTWTTTSLRESPAGMWSMVASCWETVEPAAVGLDAGKLEELAAAAEVGKSNCLVVVRHGKLAGEWYFRGTNETTAQETASASKSYTSTLVGIAQDDGDLDIDESASRWIPEWRNTPAEAVTVRDLLGNASGREWNLLLDGGLIISPDQTSYAVGLQQLHAPNTVWEYNNPAIQTLQRVMESATGQDVTELARQRLFEPLGMTQTTMTTDLSGNTLMYQGVQSTCRDMARFGQLMLDHGEWDGEQIVSPEWVEEATGQPSTELNAAYGYLWWLNRPGTIIRPLSQWIDDPGITTGPLVDGAPSDMFWALGAGNQIIQVDPGSDTVVVRLGTFELQPVPPTFGQAEGSTVTEAVIGE